VNKSERLLLIKNKIDLGCKKAGRSVDEVNLIGVSKTKTWQEIVEFIPLGLRQFGENYPQEAVAKIEKVKDWCTQNAISTTAIWHFIGHLQSNKAKLIAGKFEWIHSLDSLSTAQKISTASLQIGRKQKCLIQLNIDKEDSKGGILPDQIFSFLEELNPLEGIEVSGLMCIPNPNIERDLRFPFSETRKILEKINSCGAYKSKLKELSMGMSEDFASAIEEGSTFVRIGTALFGERKN
jgi:pyridoxal phosphate enzyme (YggS family)